MTVIFNQEWSIERRRGLRNNSTRAEVQFWNAVKGRQVLGMQFRRQYNIGRYIADFYIPQLKLVIEIDGDIHFTPEAQEYDKVRSESFASINILTIRFTNDEVFGDLEGVLERLRKVIQDRMVNFPLFQRGGYGGVGGSG
jgi:very-short-patch-repair endonuclease